jgi:phosphopantothenate synthetase
LLRFLAQQDRIAQSVGIAPSKLYAHTDGDSWDYLSIDPVTTEAQDAAADAAAKKAGMPVGPASSIEFRKYISVHTDTFAVGPMTPAQYLAMLGQ